MIFWIRWLALIGILLSCYALYVKKTAERYRKYKPLCDLAENISCTKAFMSKEGSLTGLPNPVYGLAYYILVFIATMYYQKELIFYLSIIAFATSLYLAYISYFKQKNFCLVCSSIYLINILIFAFSI